MKQAMAYQDCTIWPYESKTKLYLNVIIAQNVTIKNDSKIAMLSRFQKSFLATLRLTTYARIENLLMGTVSTQNAMPA